MADVTDADQDRALDIIVEHQSGDADPFGEIAAAIAAALAEERQKARAETMEWVIDQISQGAQFGRFA